MKYDIELSLYGKKFRFKDVEAISEEEAIDKARRKAKNDIAFCSIQPSPAVRERASNAKEVPPMSGEEIFSKFFGKR